MGTSDSSFDTSLWVATNRVPGPDPTPFEGGRVDLVVIGGGYTGCATALRAAEAGARVVVLEARSVGWGAAGRNCGQVIPGLKLDPNAMRATYGEAAGGRLAQEVGDGADLVFSLIEKHAIDCAAVRGGWVQGAHAPAALATVQKRCDQWAAMGAPVEKLDRAAISELLGTDAYLGGWIDRRAGTLHPLSYVRGLARAAQAAGARIHEGVAATALARSGDRWTVTTPKGTLEAKTVLVATDAYSGPLLPEFARSFVLVQSVLLATEPLPGDLAARIAPGGVCFSETRKLAFYFRQSPDGRLMFGGRGAASANESESFSAALVHAMHRTFPQTRGLKVTHRWSGQVGLTLDGMPRIHEPQPGLIIAGGYNGRGIAMGTLMGQWLAARILEGTAPPLPVTELKPIPWHGMRGPAIALGIAWAWLRDRAGLAA